MSAVRLRAKPDGGVRVLEHPENLPPDQLVKLRAYKDELAPIIAAYGEVEVVIRPATPILEPEHPRWPVVREGAQQAAQVAGSRDGSLRAGQLGAAGMSGLYSTATNYTPSDAEVSVTGVQLPPRR